MACGSGTLHDPRNETADAGRHGFPDSCGIGVSAGYGIVDCIADSAAASIRSRKEQSLNPQTPNILPRRQTFRTQS